MTSVLKHPRGRTHPAGGDTEGQRATRNAGLLVGFAGIRLQKGSRKRVRQMSDPSSRIAQGPRGSSPSALASVSLSAQQDVGVTLTISALAGSYCLEDPQTQV